MPTSFFSKVEYAALIFVATSKSQTLNYLRPEGFFKLSTFYIHSTYVPPSIARVLPSVALWKCEGAYFGVPEKAFTIKCRSGSTKGIYS